MKTIGLLGGMSWESSQTYYQVLNQLVAQKLGGLHSAKCLLLSVDFAEIEALQHAGEWEKLTEKMVASAQQLERGGAEGLLICTNTMHKMADSVAAAISIPLLHIADATAARIQAAGHKKVGLLGTRFTMEEDFYRGRLEKKFGLEVIVPDEAGRAEVHRVIYEELCAGQVLPESRAKYVAILQQLAAAGAECVILGCTEIQMLIDAADSPVPLFDTTRIHAEAAAEWMLDAE